MRLAHLRPGGLLLAIGLAPILCTAADAPAEIPTRPAVALPGCEALTSPKEARGDLDGAAAEWLAAALARPQEPAAALALRRLIRRFDDLTRPEDLREGSKRLSLGEGPSGEVRWLASLLLARLDRRAGAWDRAREREESLGYVRHWLAAGPLGQGGISSFETVFASEKKIDLAAEMPGGTRPVRWRTLPEPVLAGGLRPFDLLRPREGVAYFLAQMQRREAADAFLHLSIPGAHKIWLNGALLRSFDPGWESSAREVHLPVRLAVGWNRLLLKLAVPRAPGEETVWVRVLDAKGEPLKGLSFERNRQLHEAAKPLKPKGKLTSPSTIAEIERTLAVKDMDAATLGRSALVLAWLLADQGLDDEALHYLQGAEALPKNPHAQYHIGRTLERAGYLPAAVRYSRARAAYDKALALDPAFVPAILAEARLLRRDGRLKEAMRRLARASEIAPEASEARLLEAELAMALGWTIEVRAALAAFEKAHPDCPSALRLRGAFWESRGAAARALEAYRRAARADAGNLATRARSAGLMLATGEDKAALREYAELAELAPGRPDLLAELARAQTAAGRAETALATWPRVLALVPEDAKLIREYGDALRLAGKREAALAAYARALDLAPSNGPLRRLVAHLRGEEEDFSRPYLLPAEREIARAGTARDYPWAANLRVLDQTVTRVWPDGGATWVIADVRKILSPRGVDRLRTVSFRGELLEARTHLPGGGFLEPVLLPGRRSLTMPRLSTGAIAEYRYRFDQSPRGGRRFHLSPWFFRSPGLDEPHQVSDYVVILPKGMAHEVLRRNLEGVKESKNETENGLVVYRWTARDMPRVEDERFMPHIHEYLPYVEVTSPRTWKDALDDLRDALAGRVLLTRALRARAEELTHGRDTIEEKARALYWFAQKHVSRTQPGTSAHATLLSGTGDRTLLLWALFRAAKIPCDYARAARSERFVHGARRNATGRIVEAGRPPVDWKLADARQLIQPLLAVRDGARTIWLDASVRHLAFGEIPLEVQGGRALLVRPGEPVFEPLPAQKLAELGLSASVRIALSREGAAKIEGEDAVQNSLAATRRSSALGRDTDSQRRYLEGRFANIWPGCKVESFAYPGAGRPAPGGARLACKLTVKNALVESAAALECPLGLEPMKLGANFGRRSARKHPLVLARPRLFLARLVGTEEVRFKLSRGLAVKHLPENCTRTTPFGTYRLTFEKTRDGFTVRRTREIPPQRVAPEDYPAFLEFCRAVDAAEAQRVELIRK